MSSYYELLAVPPEASRDEIKQAYLRLARERHPDRFTDPAERERADAFFKELTSAYNTLSGVQTRQDYDRRLEAPKTTVPEEIASDAFARGVAKFESREFHDAVDLLQAAVQHAPNQAEYRLALGRALAQNPHWIRQALQEFDEAARLDPSSPTIYVERARIYARQGLTLRARKEAERALELAPGSQAVKTLLAELGGAEDEPPEPSGEAPAKKGLRGLFGRRS